MRPTADSVAGVDPLGETRFRHLIPGDLVLPNFNAVVDFDEATHPDGSVFELNTGPAAVEIGKLTLKQGVLGISILGTSNPPTMHFTLAEIAADTPSGTVVGLDLMSPGGVRKIAANGAAATFVKRGSYNLDLSSTNEGMENMTLQVEEGSMTSVGTASWGGGSGVTLSMKGTGEFRLSQLDDGIDDPDGTPARVLELSNPIVGTAIVVDPEEGATLANGGVPTAFGTLAIGAYDTEYGDVGEATDPVVVSLNNFAPDGVVGLDASDNYSFLLPSAVDSANGGFATEGGVVEAQGAIDVAYLSLGAGELNRMGTGSNANVTVSEYLALQGQDLDMTDKGTLYLAPTTAEVLIAANRTLTMDNRVRGRGSGNGRLARAHRRRPGCDGPRLLESHR